MGKSAVNINGIELKVRDRRAFEVILDANEPVTSTELKNELDLDHTEQVRRCIQRLEDAGVCESWIPELSDDERHIPPARRIRVTDEGERVRDIILIEDPSELSLEDRVEQLETRVETLDDQLEENHEDLEKSIKRLFERHYNLAYDMIALYETLDTKFDVGADVEYVDVDDDWERPDR